MLCSIRALLGLTRNGHIRRGTTRGTNRLRDAEVEARSHSDSFLICWSHQAKSCRHVALSGDRAVSTTAISRAARRAPRAFALSPAATRAFATLLKDTDRSRFQPALPGSDFARRSLMARLSR